MSVKLGSVCLERFDDDERYSADIEMAGIAESNT